ncbi:MAG: adenylate kinase [Pseudomonadota bacterium]
MRIAIIGNSGGGKSTLARKLANDRSLPLCDVDELLWQPGWQLTPEAEYNSEHDRVVGGSDWIIEGLGRFDSIERRLERASIIILVDLPLWQHYWLAAERQIAWAQGQLEDFPGGIDEMAPTKALFETIWTVDQTWMPQIREMASRIERAGGDVRRIPSVEQLDLFKL